MHRPHGFAVSSNPPASSTALRLGPRGHPKMGARGRLIQVDTKCHDRQLDSNARVARSPTGHARVVRCTYWHCAH